MNIKVLLADDHQVVREKIRTLIELHPDLVVIGEAVDGHDAVHQVARLAPDVVVLDIGMPRMDGLQAAQRIHDLNPATQIVILSIHAAKEYVIQALHLGVQGYVLKDTVGAELTDAICTAYARSRYVSSKIIFNLDGTFIGSLLS